LTTRAANRYPRRGARRHLDHRQLLPHASGAEARRALTLAETPFRSKTFLPEGLFVCPNRDDRDHKAPKSDAAGRFCLAAVGRVEEAVNATAFPLAARSAKSASSVVQVGRVAVGGPEIVLVAGPCAVESGEQLRDAAAAARRAGASILRGGAFKPRTSPYAFQGLGEEGLALLRAIGDETGLPVVTEAVEPAQVPLVAAYADAVQIGSRNMHMTPLLRAAGESGLPILLKRGMSATLEEFLHAAEAVLLTGNDSVILCERGIRTFDSYTRNCLDVGGIAALKRLTHLPVVADPSHATGRRELVADAGRAAVAAGADGLLVEVHPSPSDARSDAAQQLDALEFLELADAARRVAEAVGRWIRPREPEPRAESAVELDRLRGEISAADRAIVASINARLRVAAEIAAHKGAHGMPAVDLERERRMLDDLDAANSGPLSTRGLHDVYAAILAVTKREVGRVNPVVHGEAALYPDDETRPPAISS